MKRKIFLTETELVNLARVIAEQINFDLYDDEDFLDAFFQMFRNYIKRYKGVKTLDYPMSYLLKRFSVDFIRDTIGEEGMKKFIGWEEGDDLDEMFEDFVISKYDAIRIVKMAIEKQKYNLPKLVQQEKFTEKYKKVIDTFLLEDLDLPKYVQVSLLEPDPHNFIIQTTVDFESWIKDPNEVILSRSKIESKIKKFLGDYLGLEFGPIKYEQSELNYEKTNFVGVESWVKNELNKKIKKEFKTLPNSKSVKSIRFEPPSSHATLILFFNSNPRYASRTQIIDEYTEKLSELGYGPNLAVGAI